MPRPKRANQPTAPQTAPSASIGRVSSWPNRREWGLLAVVLLVGIIVRIAFPGHWGVDHFDEGVYAARLPPGPAGYAPYPLRYLYAPPLVPTLHALAFQLTGGQPWSPIVVGVFAGCLTLPVVWWLGRTWFGPLAGLVAAALAATSDVHATFSRTALTDPWLLLWFLLALYFLERALRTQALGDILATGLLTGLAWWTKYNGWLPLAVGAAAMGLRTLVAWRDAQLASGGAATPRGMSKSDLTGNASTNGSSLGGSLSVWIGVAAIAGILFYAQIYFLQADGHSYSEVTANHRRYVVGLFGWWQSLRQQCINLRWLEGPLTTVVGPLLVGAIVWVLRPVRAVRFTMLSTLPWLGAALALLSSGPALALLASRALVAWAGSWRQAASDRTWPGFLFAAWFFGLLVATPNYHPYARLTLPLVASFWLGAGWFVAWFFRDESETKVLVETSNGGEAPPACPIVASEGRWRPTLAFAGFALALVWAAPRLGDADVPAWRDRSDLRRGALALFETAYADLVKNSSMSRPGAVFLTYGEPAVYLALSDDARFATWDELALAPTGEVPRRPAEQAVFLIAGPHAEHDAAFQQALQPGQVPRLELVATRSFAPSDVLLLDQKDPRQVVGGRSTERMELRCYRVFFSAKD